MQRPRAEWQRTFSDTLETWAKTYVPLMENELGRVRTAFTPLKGSVQVAIQGISCVAQDGDGKTYIVKLVVPKESKDTTKSQQATPIPETSSDTDAPKGDGDSD
jgi:hypothetical protein